MSLSEVGSKAFCWEGNREQKEARGQWERFVKAMEVW